MPNLAALRAAILYYLRKTDGGAHMCPPAVRGLTQNAKKVSKHRLAVYTQMIYTNALCNVSPKKTTTVLILLRKHALGV